MMRETRNNQERESIVGETVYKQTLLGVILNHPRHSFKFLFKQNRYEGERITNSVDRIIKGSLPNYKIIKHHILFSTLNLDIDFIILIENKSEINNFKGLIQPILLVMI